MAAEERPEWLPEGWTMGVRTTRSGSMHRYYMSVECGQLFSSKTDVLNYLNNEKPTAHASKRAPQNIENKKQITQVENSSDWLPKGWVVEIKASKRGGKRYKSYVDPSTGTKCYSKPEVIRFLRKGEQCSTSDQENGPDPNPSNDKQNVGGTVNRRLFSGQSPRSDGVSAQMDMLLERPESAHPSDASPKCEQDTNPDVKTRRGRISPENPDFIFKEQPDSENANMTPINPSDRVLLKAGNLEEVAVNKSSSMSEIKPRGLLCNVPLEEKLDAEGKWDLNLTNEDSTKKVRRRGMKSKTWKRNSIPLRASKRLADAEADFVRELPSSKRSSKLIKRNSNNCSDRSIQPDSISKMEVELTGKSKIKEVPEKTGDDKTKDLREPAWESWQDPCIEFAFKTLTSDIPFLSDTLSIQEYFQQQLATINRSCSDGSESKPEIPINGEHPNKATEKNPKLQSSDDGLNTALKMNNICQRQSF